MDIALIRLRRAAFQSNLKIIGAAFSNLRLNSSHNHSRRVERGSESKKQFVIGQRNWWVERKPRHLRLRLRVGQNDKRPFGSRNDLPFALPA
jgi:hypothetical protein